MAYKIRTVGCFLQYKDEFVLLHRPEHKSQGGKWGLVAGKVDSGETDKETILREIKEETGYFAKQEDLELLGDWTWNFDEKTVEFPVFRIKLPKKIEIRINSNEHDSFGWFTAEKAYALPNPIHGLKDTLELVGYINKFDRKNNS
ncbi:NUDIX hydrolase [Candidatus Woesearchaeota archaeon]|jgi:8-oxo-dGTP pyrophosphatase MutT (NUDIX family)|nr:NUDIX hydrolase [Candidatus Woesearchaeota archaeon]